MNRRELLEATAAFLATGLVPHVALSSVTGHRVQVDRREREAFLHLAESTAKMLATGLLDRLGDRIEMAPCNICLDDWAKVRWDRDWYIGSNDLDADRIVDAGNRQIEQLIECVDHELRDRGIHKIASMTQPGNVEGLLVRAHTTEIQYPLSLKRGDLLPIKPPLEITVAGYMTCREREELPGIQLFGVGVELVYLESP